MRICRPVGRKVASAADYVWRNVKVDGGFAPGIVFSRAERGLAYLPTGSRVWLVVTGVAIDQFDSHFVAYTTGETVYTTHNVGSEKGVEWSLWVEGIEQTEQ